MAVRRHNRRDCQMGMQDGGSNNHGFDRYAPRPNGLQITNEAHRESLRNEFERRSEALGRLIHPSFVHRSRLPEARLGKQSTLTDCRHCAEMPLGGLAR